MKLNNRFVLGLLSLFLAGLIAFVAIPAINRQTNGKTEIVRMAAFVPRGALITRQDIEIAEVGKYNLPLNIAKVADDVVGKYAAADLAAGDYILSSKISFIPITSDIQLSNIPSGKVAVSLSIKTLAGGLSNKLQAGDIIRIYHYLDMVKDIPELQFVKILSVTDSKGVNVDNAREMAGDEEKKQTAALTLLASPEQAKIIIGIENDGAVHAALISRNNGKLADELLAQQELILQSIYFPADESEQITNEEE